MVSFLQGRRFAVQGDSISLPGSWQKVVLARTGMTLVTQDARSGRGFATAFECWGTPALGAKPGVFTAAYSFPGYPGATCGQEVQGLTDGETFAQSLANIDLLIVQLGSSDYGIQIGQLGDSTSAGTLYGNVRWVVETYLTAKPSLRLVLVTNQFTAFAPPSVTQADANAIAAYGNSVGVPVINMFTLGGLNAITASALTSDGTHPNDFGFANFYGPVIAQGLQHLF